MTKKINLSSIGFAGAFVALLLVSAIPTHKAHAILSSQIGPGSTGADVSMLQQFLSTNSFIYPAGIINGNYGPMTRAAVVQFQLAHDISPLGNVGPMTFAKINSIMASGRGLDTSAPILMNAAASTNRTSATINWGTNELANAQVFFDTNPLQVNEASYLNQLPYVSGMSASNNSGNNTSQSVTLANLAPNTFYYYLARAVDGSGNVSQTLSNTFRTN